jgi:hypothetical protein
VDGEPWGRVVRDTEREELLRSQLEMLGFYRHEQLRSEEPAYEKFQLAGGSYSLEMQNENLRVEPSEQSEPAMQELYSD